MKPQSHKPHFHVAAGLLWKEGRVLIARRPPGSHLGGLWEFPGGKLEQGEAVEGCLKREIGEELGLQVHTARPVLTVFHEYKTKSITLHIFDCLQWEGTPRPLQRQELRWVHPEDLGTLPFPPPDKKVIRFLTGLER